MTKPVSKPFKNNLQYITATLEYLKTLARLRIVERRLEDGRHGAQVAQSGPEAVPAVTQVDGLSSLRRLRTELRREVNDGRRGLLERTAATTKFALPLETLAREHALNEFEKLVLMAVLGPDLDFHFARALGVMNGREHYRDIRMVLELLCNSLEEQITARRYFVYSSKLLGDCLLNMAYSREIGTECDFLDMWVAVPRRISSLILGEYDVDDELLSFSAVMDPEVELDQVVMPPGKREEVLELLLNREQYLECRRNWGFDDILSYGKGTVILFSGPSGTGKTMLAHALAHETKHRLMLVDIDKIMKSSLHDFERNLQMVFHEARLQHAILFFDEADEMFMDRCANAVMPTLLREFEKLDGICILATNRRQVLDEALERRILYELDFELPTPEMRALIWRRHLPAAAPVATDVDVTVLAEEFEFSGGYIKNAVLVAMTRAMQRSGAAQRITQDDLRAGAAVQLRNRLAAHADKIAPKVTLVDVVLPAGVQRQVTALVAAARQRATVFSTWGFGRKLTLGRGITALFSGPSGTGKTMTAEAVACELGQNLYPVRLARILSKHVGDTEKNLMQIFDAAREAQALILFDEADALFSARLDDGDHHAHYINQQINVLLTEIEKFDGVVILATNRAQAFDPAFERRIRYRVVFPQPDAVAREAIWRGMLPPEAPLAADVNLAALAAEYDFAGGTIKNVVLRAAFAAATDGKVITMAILRQCAEEEAPLKQAGVIGFAGLGATG